MAPEVQLGARALKAGSLVILTFRLIRGGPKELGFSEQDPRA